MSGIHIPHPDNCEKENCVTTAADSAANIKVDSFKLPADFLEKFEVPNSISLTEGWTTGFKESFKKNFPECKISFNYNKCLKGLNPDQRVWSARAYCTHVGCAKFKFHITKNDIIVDKEITVHVEITGTVNHNTKAISKGIESSCDISNNEIPEFYGNVPLSFEVPCEVWNSLKSNESQLRLNKGWTDIFRIHFSSQNSSSCDLSFDDNKFLTGQRDHKIWYGNAHCKKAGCAHYKFSVYSYDVKPGGVLIRVAKIGDIVHDNENLLQKSNNTLEDCDDPSNEIGHFQLYVPKSFWTTYKKEESQIRLSQGWTDDLNDCFKLVNNSCVLAFDDNKCLKSVGKGGRIWYAIAHCTHSGCASFEFNVTSVQDDVEIIVNVERKGFYCHENEVRRRFFRWKKRKAVSDNVEHTSPSIVKFKMLSRVSESVLQKGNRNEAPSNIILRKISSETKQKYDLDKDLQKFLYKLKEKYIADEKYKGTYIQGLIQAHIIHPLVVVMFTERQVTYTVHLSRENDVLAHLDATGTIVANVQGEKRPYYYALILPAVKDVRPAFPLLEFISTCHNVNFLLFCLNLFVQATKNFIKKEDTKPVIDKIEIDWSLALMQSVCRAFNDMTLLQYLQFVWMNIDKKTGKIHSKLNLTLLHICSSHLCNSGRKRIKEFTTDETVRQYQMFVLTALIHTTDLQTAANIIGHVVNVFGLKKETPDFHKSLAFIEETTKTGEAECSEAEKLEHDEESEQEIKQIFLELRYESPFFQYFEKIALSALQNEPKTNDSKLKKNDLYCRKFVEYLLYEILPLYPLMSGIAIQQFGIKRDTNNSIENWMGFIKNIEFGKKMKNEIPRFIQQHELTMDGRYKEIMYSLVTTRQMEGRKKKKLKIDTEKKRNEPALNNVEGNSQKCASTEEVKEKKSENIIPKVETKTAKENELKKTIKKLVNEPEKPLNASTIKPWTGAKFPEVPQENIKKYGITMDNISFGSLLPHRYIDNCIIDVFSAFLASKFQDISLLNFPTDYVKILTNKEENDAAIIKWCQKIRAHRYDCWLLPIHDSEVHKTGHWTLLLVVLSQKILIYFDSLHRWPQEYWIARVGSLIEQLCINKNSCSINWSEWTLFSPDDIPVQGGIMGTSNNCGAHISVWTYILYSGEKVDFEELDSYEIRPWIMNMILKPDLPKGKQNFTFEISETATIMNHAQLSKIRRQRNPPNYFCNTLDFAASLKAILQAMKF